MTEISPCHLCPRRCGADRPHSPGRCGAGEFVRAARAAPHFWEEPCISGTCGSGAVFFSGCSLQCVFCQNEEISYYNKGVDLTVPELSDVFLRLEQQGVHNINLVNPTHYLPQIRAALERAKLSIPVVYNSGGYDKPGALLTLKGLVQVWLPDLKWYDARLSARYADAPNYFEMASQSILTMRKLAPRDTFDEAGLMQQGLIIRHLILPGMTGQSMAILRWIAAELGPKTGISLMAQYTPFGRAKALPELNRTITRAEYERVKKAAALLGFSHGYVQELCSADADFVPPFDFTGLLD